MKEQAKKAQELKELRQKIEDRSLAFACALIQSPGHQYSLKDCLRLSVQYATASLKAIEEVMEEYAVTGKLPK